MDTKKDAELESFWREFKSKFGSMGSMNECYLEFSLFSDMTLKQIKNFHDEIKSNKVD